MSVIVYFCILFFASLAQAAAPDWNSKLGKLAASMSAGTFQEITGSTGFDRAGILGGIFNVGDQSGCASNDNIMEYGVDAAWDPLHNEIRELGWAHGATTCYFGALARYKVSTDTWDWAPWPSAGGIVPQRSGGGAHSWDETNAVELSTGRQFIHSGDYMPYYDPATEGSGLIINAHTAFKWSATNSLRWWPELYGGAGGLIQCNADFGCFTLDIRNVSNDWEYKVRSTACLGGCWTGMPSIAPDSHYNTESIYNTVDHNFYLFSTNDNGQFAFWKMTVDNVEPARGVNVERLQDTPFYAGIQGGTGAADPVSGDIIYIFGSGHATTVYAYNAAQGWHDTGITFPTDFSDGSSGLGAGDGLVSVALPEYGVIWFGKHAQTGCTTCRGTWLFKYNASSGPTPPNITIGGKISVGGKAELQH